MRSLILCIFLVLFAWVSAAQAAGTEPGWGRVYTVKSKVAVRENPAESALQVRALTPGQKVRVDFEQDGWAAVFDPTEKVHSELRAQGYVRLTELRSNSRTELGSGIRTELGSGAWAGIGLRAENADAPAKGKLEPKEPQKPKESKAKEPKVKEPKAREAKAFGEIRVADRQMAVRAGRDKDTAFVRLLKAGQRVRVDFQEDGWFAVFDPDEKVRDLAKAWGYGRDKYLVPEKDYAGQPLPDTAPAAKEAAKALAKPDPAAKEPSAKPVAATPTPKPKRGSGDDEAVGYSVIDRHTDHQRPLSPVVLRVRIEVPAPPAPEALRKIMREIWKAERRKNEDLQLEVLLPGMDQAGLAYAVGRFHDDGRIREFWWRDVVLRPRK